MAFIRCAWLLQLVAALQHSAELAVAGVDAARMQRQLSSAAFSAIRATMAHYRRSLPKWAIVFGGGRGVRSFPALKPRKRSSAVEAVEGLLAPESIGKRHLTPLLRSQGLNTKEISPSKIYIAWSILF
jgi:hypothetical protein